MAMETNQDKWDDDHCFLDKYVATRWQIPVAIVALVVTLCLFMFVTKPCLAGV